MFFMNPAVLLEYMLRAEASHDAFYKTFPHLRGFAKFYDHFSVPIKLTLLTLVRQSKTTATHKT